MGLTEFLYFEGALIVGCLLTAGLGILALPAAYFRAARLCFILAATAFLGLGIMWGVMTDASSRTRIIICALVGAIAAVAVTEALRMTTTLETKNKKEGEQAVKPVPDSAQLAPSILLDVAFDNLPRVSPPDGTIHIFEITQEQTGIEASVVEHQFNPSQVIDWKQRFPDWPIFGVSKCEITSATNEPVSYAVIPINLVFREMIPYTPGQPIPVGGMAQSTNGIQMVSGKVMLTKQSTFRVGRIYPQTPYVIYFLNRTKFRVDIEVPNEGKVQDFNKTGTNFESKLNMKLDRTTGLHLAAAIPVKPLLAPPPPATSQPNTLEKK